LRSIVRDADLGQTEEQTGSKPPSVKVTITFVFLVSGASLMRIAAVDWPEIILPADKVQFKVRGLSCEPPLIDAETEKVSPGETERFVV